MKFKLVSIFIFICCVNLVAQTNDSVLTLLNKCTSLKKKEQQIQCLYTTYRLTENEELASFCVEECKKLVIKNQFTEGESLQLDSVIGWVFNEIGYEYSFQGKVDSAIWAYSRGLIVRRKAGDSIGVSNIYVNIGFALQTISKFDEALKYYKLAESNYIRFKKYTELAGNYNNIASIYNTKGDVRNAIDNLMLSMKYYDKAGNQKGVAWIYNSLGYVYFQQNERKLAGEWYKKALDLATQLDYKEALALIYNNIGSLEKENNNTAKAIEYHLRALKLRKLMRDIRGEIMSLNNIGSLLMMTHNYMRAELYLNDCKQKCIETNFVSGLTKCYINLASLKYNQGKMNEAKVFSDSAYTLSKMTDNVDQVLEASERAYRIEKDLGNVNKALFYLEEVMLLRDSLNSKAIQRELYKKQFEYDLDKEQQAFDFQKRKKELELEQQRKVKNVFIISLICVVVLGIYITYGLFQTRKKNRIISLQKEFIEDKQKEIVDSITYAKRLQEAILPNDDLLKDFFSDSFVLYKPKDIVAGDFYWFDVQDNTLFVAAADSTGHGVPGAMVSIVCYNALDKSVREFGLKKPGEILDKTRELVLETFTRSGEEIRDGMDISLVAIELSELKKEKIGISWSGANNPLWYLTDGVMHELKANKQPVGKAENPVPFSTQTMELKKGDTVYLFTDGYADQFGNEEGATDSIGAFGKGKKFKYKRLKDYLVSLSNENMDSQRQTLEKRFNSWKGILEQVDDVTIIGLKL